MILQELAGGALAWIAVLALRKLAIAAVGAIRGRLTVLSPSAGPPARNPELHVFRISQIFAKVVTTFQDAEKSIEAAAETIYQHLPSQLQAMVKTDVSLAKQYVSDAIGKVDTALSSHEQAIAMAVEQAADTELALVTGGKSVALNELTNAFVDGVVASGTAAFHNWALSVKAKMATDTPAPAAAAPTAPPAN